MWYCAGKSCDYGLGQLDIIGLGGLSDAELDVLQADTNTICIQARNATTRKERNQLRAQCDKKTRQLAALKKKQAKQQPPAPPSGGTPPPDSGGVPAPSDPDYDVANIGPGPCLNAKLAFNKALDSAKAKATAAAYRSFANKKWSLVGKIQKVCAALPGGGPGGGTGTTTVAAPTISPSGQVNTTQYPLTVNVSISSSTPNATIKYSTDGTIPGNYTGIPIVNGGSIPVTIPAAPYQPPYDPNNPYASQQYQQLPPPVVVNAVAFLNGVASGVATASFSAQAPYQSPYYPPFTGGGGGGGGGIPGVDTSGGLTIDGADTTGVDLTSGDDPSVDSGEFGYTPPAAIQPTYGEPGTSAPSVIQSPTVGYQYPRTWLDDLFGPAPEEAPVAAGAVVAQPTSDQFGIDAPEVEMPFDTVGYDIGYAKTDYKPEDPRSNIDTSNVDQDWNLMSESVSLSGLSKSPHHHHHGGGWGGGNWWGGYDGPSVIVIQGEPVDEDVMVEV